MEVRKITEEDIPLLIEYGNKVFPKRSKHYPKLIDFYFRNRISEFTGGLIMLKDGKICGQTFTLGTTMWYKGKKYPTCWGLDLIIDKDLRKDAAGVDLILASRKTYPQIACIGSGPLALKINLKGGYRMAGEIRKYVSLTSPFFSPLFMLLPRKRKFPKSIGEFSLLTDPAQFKSMDFRNEQIIEIGRDTDFVSWRYFTPVFRKYFVYQNNSGDYFVVRPIRYKHIPMMCLVDFRCELNTEDSFSLIFKEFKRLSMKMRVPFLLCGSSHMTVDRVLEANGMKSIGRPRPIILRNALKKELDSGKVENRMAIFATFADSDGEVSWD